MDISAWEVRSRTGDKAGERDEGEERERERGRGKAGGEINKINMYYEAAQKLKILQVTE